MITDSWYKESADFIHHFNKRKLPTNRRPGETVSSKKRIEIKEKIATIPIQRVNDKFIMNEFIKAKFSKSQLKILNIMRMYLQAFTLSDISSADGKSITYNSWNMISSNGVRSKFDWPRNPPDFTDNKKNCA